MDALDRLATLSRQNHPDLDRAETVLADVIAVSGSWISATVREDLDQDGSAGRQGHGGAL